MDTQTEEKNKNALIFLKHIGYNKSTNPEDEIDISAGAVDRRFYQLVVKCKYKVIRELFDLYNAREPTNGPIFASTVLKLMDGYTNDEIVAHAKANSQEYINWVNDVVTYYVMQLVRSGALIPIIKNGFNPYLL
jgi:hypothetical protein